MSDGHGLIVVAGAGGFIGGHLVGRLLEQGLGPVRAVDRKPVDRWYQRHPDAESIQADLTEGDACRAVVREAHSVYDLAADMGGMGFIETHKAACMLSALISGHLLAASHGAGVKRFFFSSSACVYNLAKQQSVSVRPLAESDAYPADPEDGYGWEKLFSERLCRHFAEEYELTCRVARYHNVYGPFGTWEGGREKAPAAICRKVAQAKLEGTDEIEIWGDGHQTRSFMYIDDCIEGTIRIMESDVAEPLNLGSSQLVSINNLVDIVEDIAGVRLRRRYNHEAPNGVRGRNSDNTLIQNRLNWQPSIPLEMGMGYTYKWIYDELRAGRHDGVGG